MRRLLAFVGGVLSGGALGTGLVLFFTPASGDTLRERLRTRLFRAAQAGERAGQLKRQELEMELVSMTTPYQTGSPVERYRQRMGH
ncbi:MAG: YtxH domain-containing protein [Chloroflexi bacterium]|nr:YtxH domain-containing protein [Chloroflexota bacterium]